MIRITLLICAFLLSSSFTEVNKNKRKDQTLLWKIEGNNMNTSYLFGTIHMISKSQFVMPLKAIKAFEGCEELVMEIDITQPGLMSEMMKYSLMNNGQTLKELLSENQYVVIDSALKAETGLGLQTFNQFKPFVIESYLIQKLIEGEMASYEEEFAEMAKRRSIKISALETVREQMSIFDSISYKDQVEDLMKYIRQEPEMRAMFQSMVRLYLNEDLQGLEKYMTEYYQDPSILYHMLYKRNENWIGRIEEKMAKRSLFIAVGAGHLPGSKGVIELLRESGYKVTPVH